MVSKIRLGTRGSKLAMVQTQMVADALAAAWPGIEIEIIQMSTVGDRKQGTAQAARSDKRDWIQDLEVALLEGRVDLVMHSAKDVPEDFSGQTLLLPVLRRADPGDVFIGKFLKDVGRRVKLAELRPGDMIGTASLRRQAQLLAHLPGIHVIDHRGNVPTRVEKLDGSERLQGIVLAQAGVDRLQLSDLEYERLPSDWMLPAINQGIIAVQVMRNNQKLIDLLARIQHPGTIAEFEAERGVVTEVKADCDSAICIFAEASSTGVVLRTKVLTPDGVDQLSLQGSASWKEAAALGRSLGVELNQKGAQVILDKSREIRARRVAH